MLLECGHNFAVVLFARLAFRRNNQCGQSTLSGNRNSARVDFVGDDDRDARIRNAPGIDAVSDRDKVRAAPGEKNA
jgi:hypothetical protein